MDIAFLGDKAHDQDLETGSEKNSPDGGAMNRDTTWHLDSSNFRIFGFNSPLIYSEKAWIPAPLSSIPIMLH
jgi:hypothetical protein